MQIIGEDNSIKQKKSEFSIFFWLGLTMIPLSIYFCYFYFKKKYYLNFDSFSIISDTETINTAVSRYIPSYTFTTLRFYLNDNINFITDLLTIKSTRISNYFFTSILHSLLFIKRGGYLNSISYLYRFYLSINLNSNFLLFNLKLLNKKIFFSIPINQYNTTNPENFEKLIINEIHFNYFNYDSISSIVIEKIIYKKESSIITCFIHDSREMENYYFPLLEDQGIIIFSFITLFLSIILVMIFLWHCWSVKFIIIDKVIQDNSPQQKYY